MKSVRLSLRGSLRSSGFRQPRLNSEPAWAAEARQKYEEEQRRKQARKAQIETVKEDYTNLDGIEDFEGTSDALPVVDKDGWLIFQNLDTFSSDIAEVWNPTESETAGIRTVEEAKFHCEKMNYGGFTQKWQLIYMFKGNHPRRLVAGRTECTSDNKGLFNLYIRPEVEGVVTLEGELKVRLDTAIKEGNAPTLDNSLDQLEDDDWKADDVPLDTEEEFFEKELEKQKEKEKEKEANSSPTSEKDDLTSEFESFMKEQKAFKDMEPPTEPIPNTTFTPTSPVSDDPFPPGTQVRSLVDINVCYVLLYSFISHCSETIIQI